jgi:hypothetical protein
MFMVTVMVTVMSIALENIHPRQAEDYPHLTILTRCLLPGNPVVVPHDTRPGKDQLQLNPSEITNSYMGLHLTQYCLPPSSASLTLSRPDPFVSDELPDEHYHAASNLAYYAKVLVWLRQLMGSLQSPIQTAQQI